MCDEKKHTHDDFYASEELKMEHMYKIQTGDTSYTWHLTH